MTPEQFASFVGAITDSTWAIIGTLWALIFASTWKG